jgi:hypothetical protein
MQTYELNPEVFDPRTRAAAEADAKLFVEFYMHYQKDDGASEKAGRPIFIDLEFIRITTPGDRNNILERPLTEIDRRRFAQRYAAWKATGEATSDVGTKLDEWPLITRSQVEELRYFQIRTVEHLAGVGDQVLQRIPGLVGLRDRASAWLAATKDTQMAEKMAKELQLRDEANARLQAQVEQLVQQVQSLLSTEKRKSA